MKKLVSLVMVAVLVLAATSAALADGEEFTEGVSDNPHKVRNKWDLSGTFTAYPGYDWSGMAADATWTYKVHIKEAMSGEYSVGTVHFTSDTGVDVVGHVEETKREYDYSSWTGQDLLAAVGTAEYNDETYYFMFLYANRAVWLALSMEPYEGYWDNENVWAGNLREYEVHSLVTDDYPLDYKMIH